MQMINCPLCLSEDNSLILEKKTGQKYWDCKVCGLIFLESKFHLPASEERERYLTHNNDITDPRYQKFVSPIVDYVIENLPKGAFGLDFGAGTGPVISSMLTERGYNISLFDPFFWNAPSALESIYDFIVSCEVVEHFCHPAKEFKKLRSLLKNNGHLAIMTELFEDHFRFDDWYYHRDPTHVVFYRVKTLEWIREKFAFSSFDRFKGRAFVLRS